MQVIRDFARCDHDKIHNPSGYLMGMLRKYNDNPPDSRDRDRPLSGNRNTPAARNGSGGATGAAPRTRGLGGLLPVRSGVGMHRTSSSQLNGYTPRGGHAGDLPLTPKADELSGDRRSQERSREERSTRERSGGDRDRVSDHRDRERSYSGRDRSRSDRCFLGDSQATFFVFSFFVLQLAPVR